LIGATAPAQIDAALDAVALAERLTPDDVAELRRLAGSRLSVGVPSFLLLSRMVRGQPEVIVEHRAPVCHRTSVIEGREPPRSVREKRS
jgi:hypothetical protein